MDIGANGMKDSATPFRRIPSLLAVCMLLAGPPLGLYGCGAMLSDDYLASNELDLKTREELDPSLRWVATIGFFSGIVMTVVGARRLNRKLFAVLLLLSPERAWNQSDEGPFFAACIQVKNIQAISAIRTPPNTTQRIVRTARSARRTLSSG
jgi:hypothetical protein